MFTERIIEGLMKKAYPDRAMNIEKMGGKFFSIPQDQTGCHDYLLDGTYSYEEVKKLNALTTFSETFGYCKELGPIAFIGVPNENYLRRSGYFHSTIDSYGKPHLREDELYFKLYKENQAKNIANYTVYGMYGLEEVAKAAPIKEMNAVYDSRYKVKKSKQPKIIDMDCKLNGLYNYNDAKLLATGTLEEKDDFCGENQPIAFAVVSDYYYVGIINLKPSHQEFVRGFRDVWEYGTDEPLINNIRFLSNEEAAKIKFYTLCVYDYSCSGIRRNKYNVKKVDRTLDKRFKFQLPDGTDYRLIEHTELFR